MPYYIRIVARIGILAENLAMIAEAACALEKSGEGGIRTLGTLLRYNALAKRRFRPLSHLTNQNFCSKELYPPALVVKRNLRQRGQWESAGRREQGKTAVRAYTRSDLNPLPPLKPEPAARSRCLPHPLLFRSTRSRTPILCASVAQSSLAGSLFHPSFLPAQILRRHPKDHMKLPRLGHTRNDPFFWLREKD